MYDWLSYVRNGYNKETTEKIAAIRTLQKGTVLYDKIKEDICCITPNALFNKKKSNNNIICPTGYLFIDVDKPINISAIDKTKIYSYYKSIGGQGYCILVRVQDLTERNFSAFYKNIVNDLGLQDVYDKYAKKITQYSLISADPDLYINPNSFIYTFRGECVVSSSNREEEEEKKMQKVDTTIKLKRIKENIMGNVHFFDKIKFEVELDRYDEECVYIPEGKEYYKTYLPFHLDGSTKKIHTGKRHTVLSCYLHNLICLNEDMTKEQAIKIMTSIAKQCVDVVSGDYIRREVGYKFKKNKEKKLLPLGVKIKRYWVAPKVKNKLEAYQKKRKKITTDKIEMFFGDEILNLSTKVTNKTIADYCGVNEKTIRRYVIANPEYEEIKNKHNELVTKNKNKRTTKNKNKKLKNK